MICGSLEPPDSASQTASRSVQPLLDSLYIKSLYFTDHFRVACSDLYVHIALLFSGLLTHGSVPDEFRLNTVIPISKDRQGVSSDSSEYRGIALIAIFGKVLDLIIPVGALKTSRNLRNCNACTLWRKISFCLFVDQYVLLLSYKFM